MQDRLTIFNKLTNDFEDFLKNERNLKGILNLNKQMWNTIAEIKQNNYFKNRLVHIKGNYDLFYNQEDLTNTEYNRQNNENFALTSRSHSQFKKVQKQKKIKKLNHQNLYYNSYQRNYFNVYKNNFGIYFDQANFRSLNKYYSKISEKKNIKIIVIDLIRKRINQKVYTTLTDRKNSIDKINYNASPKILNNNVSIISNPIDTIGGNNNYKYSKKRNVFHRFKNEIQNQKDLFPEDRNYNIIKKTFLKKNINNNKENIIKKINYPLTFSEEEKKEEYNLKPTIIKECDEFITKTLMDKMGEFKITFTDNLTKKLNVKEALKRLKYLDKKNNFNDYMDEIFSTDNIIDNYNKNKYNIRIIKPDMLGEIKKKKSDFYQNLVENKRALLETRSNYYIKLERNKLGIKIDVDRNKNLQSTKISKTETTTQCDFYKEKDLKKTTVTYLQEQLIK